MGEPLDGSLTRYWPRQPHGRRAVEGDRHNDLLSRRLEPDDRASTGLARSRDNGSVGRRLRPPPGLLAAGLGFSGRRLFTVFHRPNKGGVMKGSFLKGAGVGFVCAVLGGATV